MRGQIKKRLIVVMAKQPIAGQTKTRLMPPLTGEQAAEFYTCLLQDKFAQMRQVTDAQPGIAYWPSEARAFFAEFAPGFTLIAQEGANLGERLANMMAAAFDMGYEQVMALDGDTPTLPPAYLQAGFDKLDDPAVDLTLGPTEDGGYYAIAMKELHRTVFDVEMSTPRVFEDTLAQVQAADLNVETLDVWHDVDRPADLQRLKAELAANGRVQSFAAGRYIVELDI